MEAASAKKNPTFYISVSFVDTEWMLCHLSGIAGDLT